MKNSMQLKSKFCGITLENPFLLSSSCITNDGRMLSRAFESGWAGAVFKTLNSGIMEMKQPSPRMSSFRNQYHELIGIQNVEQISDRKLEDNLSDIKQLKKTFPEKILIASIMGFSVEDWQFLAKSAEDSGADMIECNYSCPNMTVEASGSHISKTYPLLEGFTEAIKKVVKIPVLAKLTPNITDINIPAHYAKSGGADGISAINTVAGISSIDLSNFVPSPNVAGLGAASGHSGSMIKPIGLKMVSDLAMDRKLNLPISGIGGIETWIDAVEYLSVGASNIQLTTAVITYGYRIIEDLIEGLMDFLLENQFSNIDELKGMALKKLVNTSKFDLSKQGEAIFDLNKCIGCGRCYIACQDAGSGKLGWDDIQRKPEISEKECFSCMSCQFVCPVENLVKFSY